MLKIRRPLGRLIFNMGIAIPGKTVFLIETAPWFNYESLYWTMGFIWSCQTSVKLKNVSHDAKCHQHFVQPGWNGNTGALGKQTKAWTNIWTYFRSRKDTKCRHVQCFLGTKWSWPSLVWMLGCWLFGVSQLFKPTLTSLNLGPTKFIFPKNLFFSYNDLLLKSSCAGLQPVDPKIDGLKRNSTTQRERELWWDPMLSAKRRQHKADQ